MQRPINFTTSNVSPPVLVNDKPLLVGYEGLDASGKATQTQRLAAALNTTTLLDFPHYSTPTGTLIKSILKGTAAMDARFVNDEYNDAARALTLQALMTVNRYELSGTIRAALLKGQSVVLDRYFGSGIAYGKADGLPADWLAEIHRDLPWPDLYFLLDIPVTESFKRRPVREDAYEANAERLAMARAHYIQLWENPPAGLSWRAQPTKYVTIDGTQHPDVITAEIIAHTATFRSSLDA